VTPRLAAIVILPVLLHLHLSVAVAGTTVAVSLPVLIPVALAVSAGVVLALSWRSMRGFRSSPYMRPAGR
jgi:hypothetical protein